MNDFMSRHHCMSMLLRVNLPAKKERRPSSSFVYPIRVLSVLTMGFFSLSVNRS